MRANEILTELFTQPYPYRFGSTGNWAEFKAADGSDVEVRFNKFNDYRVINISFERNGRYSLTGAGDSFKIMATVVKIVGEWIQSKTPPIIMFTADLDEPSRVQLYARLTQKLIQQFGYTDISGHSKKLANKELAAVVAAMYWDHSEEKRVFFLARQDMLAKPAAPISEAPLPPDWDEQAMVARKGTTIKSRLQYALERAQRLGAGSSRVAMIIPYQGRETVLKVAKNRKGLAQNAEEVSILNDGYFSQQGILIPLIDYAEGPEVTWLQTELAQKIPDNRALTNLLGADIRMVLEYVKTYSGKFRYSRANNVEQYREIIMKEVLPGREEDFITLAEQLYDLQQGSALDLDDLYQEANWGVYQGRPVIIDAGYAGSVIPMYRMR